MTEMNESASILNNVSDRSLILLDERLRTSTYDGILYREAAHEKRAQRHRQLSRRQHES
jgi:DNA mismatch repair protein MutS